MGETLFDYAFNELYLNKFVNSFNYLVKALKMLVKVRGQNE